MCVQWVCEGVFSHQEATVGTKDTVWSSWKLLLLNIWYCICMGLNCEDVTLGFRNIGDRHLSPLYESISCEMN